MVKRSVLAAGLLVGAGPTAAFAVPQFENGSFEEDTVSAPFATVNPGSGALQGWEIGGAGVDHIGRYWQPAEGDQSLDLSQGDAGSVEQTVTGFTVGRAYELLFDLSGNPDNGNKIKEVNVAVNGGSLASGSSSVFSFDTNSTNKNDMGWATQALLFTADVSDVTFTFTSLNESAWGPALDNVRLELVSGTITDVPTPATFGLLGGALFAVGCYLRCGRSRRNRGALFVVS